MMGRVKSDQGQLFYEFHLGDAVPEDHLVRKIDAALDLSWLRSELALQLLLLRASESMGNHDSNVVGAGRVG
jgi:hypothetical protein